MQKINHLGFSLLEILITLTLIAILSVLGQTAYTHFITRAHRLLAMQTLMTAATELERYALAHGHYQGADLHLPENESTGYRYDANLSATTYTLTAEPTANNHDTCGRLSLSETREMKTDSDNSYCFTR